MADIVFLTKKMQAGILYAIELDDCYKRKALYEYEGFTNPKQL